MPLYRKKPVVIEAIQLTVDNIDGLADWCHGHRCGLALPRSNQCISIDTLEGAVTAQMGDFVIKGVAGEFYPCKPDIFAKTYDAE